MWTMKWTRQPFSSSHPIVIAYNDKPEQNSLQTLTKSNDAEMQKCNKNIQTRRNAKYAMNMITNNSRTPNVEPNKCNLYHSWLCSILPYFAVVWFVWFSYPSSTLKLFEVIKTIVFSPCIFHKAFVITFNGGI